MQSLAWNKGTEIEYQGEEFELVSVELFPSTMEPDKLNRYLSELSEEDRNLINTNSEFLITKPLTGITGVFIYQVPLHVEGNGISITPK